MATRLRDIIAPLPQERQDKIHKESDLLFDEFLKGEGIYEECRKYAIRSVLDFIGTLSREDRNSISEYEKFLINEVDNEQ